MKRKILSILMAVVMIMAAMPVINADDTAADLEISTLAQLEAFRDDVNGGNTYEGKTVTLTADIDMSEKYGEGKESWTPIGTFAGTFNGANHTISGLYSYTEEEYGGASFFRVVSGIVQNLNVKGSVIAEVSPYDGSAAGIALNLSVNAQMLDCSFEGLVKNPHYTAGGLVSGNMGLISDCRFKGKVDGMHLVGGIACTGDGTITNCINDGEIIGTMPIGGIAGCSHKIENCINRGSVTGITNVSTGIDRNGNECTYIKASENVGGIVGSITADSTVENCYNTGAVSGNTYVGGILGSVNNFGNEPTSLATVKNCYNIGNVISTLENDEEHYIGGIIGTVETEFNELDNGAITGNMKKAIAGKAVNCYYLTGTADKGIAVVGEGGTDPTTMLTTEQVADKTNFTNWDFDTVWDMDETFKRPVLRSNREEPPIEPTSEPTTEPTLEPTIEPTTEPTADPTTEPTATPTLEPTAEPTLEPTTEPTTEPTAAPTAIPDTECVKITAEYSDSGALISVTAEKVKVSEIVRVKNTATRKIFYWESLKSMKPIL